MDFICYIAFVFGGLFALTDARLGNQHEPRPAQQYVPRQMPALAPQINTSFSETTATAKTTIAYVTPSPGARPVPITEQSQLVTSYVPRFTLCELLPNAAPTLVPVPSGTLHSAQYSNRTLAPGNHVGTCTTIYSEMETMMCTTTLTDLVTRHMVSSCDQELTFSTRYGYTLVQPTPMTKGNISLTLATGAVTPVITPGPSVETLTTYFLAPWQELTAGTAPANVQRKVCRALDDGAEECVTETEVWHTSSITMTTTRTTTIDISTTIYGASQVRVETFVANVTESMTIFSLSTTMEVEYETEIETTSAAGATLTTTGPTSFSTVTVQLASPTIPSSGLTSDDSTSTTTILVTSTTTRTSTVFVHPTVTEIAGTRPSLVL